MGKKAHFEEGGSSRGKGKRRVAGTLVRKTAIVKPLGPGWSKKIRAGKPRTERNLRPHCACSGDKKGSKPVATRSRVPEGMKEKIQSRLGRVPE